jgi:hypothetical protein
METTKASQTSNLPASNLPADRSIDKVRQHYSAGYIRGVITIGCLLVRDSVTIRR